TRGAANPPAPCEESGRAPSASARESGRRECATHLDVRPRRLGPALLSLTGRGARQSRGWSLLMLFHFPAPAANACRAGRARQHCSWEGRVYNGRLVTFPPSPPIFQFSRLCMTNVAAIRSSLFLLAGCAGWLSLTACGAEDSSNSNPPRPFASTPANTPDPVPTGDGEPLDPGGSGAPSGPESSAGGSSSEQPLQDGQTPLSPEGAGMQQPGGGGGEMVPAGEGAEVGNEPPVEPPPEPFLERPTRGTRNLFTELLGIPVGDVDQKLATAANRIFGI